MDIIEQTRALALELQKDQRFLIMENERRMADADEELQQQIGEFNLARLDLNQEIAKQDRNADRIAELNDKIQAAYTAVMNNSTMIAYNNAQAELNKLVEYMNAIINTAAQGGDPMTVEEPSGCTGDCSSCGGSCH